ncbi:MAG: NAD-dependent protein deacetylase [Anaerolineae bacterium]
MTLDQKIEQAATLINQANTVVAMTGAGISTLSGIPDFRSPDSGVWRQDDPLSVASIHAFRHNPETFYRWIHPLSKLFFEAEPNPAHLALASLERKGKLSAIVTQNIDNLHQRAGSKTVFELHGHLRQATCTQCYRVQDSRAIFEKFIADGEVPHCPDCGGVLKPNAILFGEQLPMQEFVAAQMAIQGADLMLLVGSSLEVAPASDLPHTALDNGASVIIINYLPTFLDSQAQLVINDNIATILPRIDALIPG